MPDGTRTQTIGEASFARADRLWRPLLVLRTVRYRANDGHQHPPIRFGPRNHLMAMPAPIYVEQGSHRLSAAGDQAVAAHGPVTVTRRDMARARGDAPVALIEPNRTMGPPDRY